MDITIPFQWDDPCDDCTHWIPYLQSH